MKKTSTERNRQWRKKNPEKAKEIAKRANEKRKGKRILDRAKKRKGFFSIAYKKEILRLLSMGKDEVTIAMRLHIPVSEVKKINLNFLDGQ